MKNKNVKNTVLLMITMLFLVTGIVFTVLFFKQSISELLPYSVGSGYSALRYKGLFAFSAIASFAATVWLFVTFLICKFKLNNSIFLSFL